MYKYLISNKHKKWVVCSYMGHPILYAHLIWKLFTAAFSRYGTLFYLEGYKDPISNKYKKWMVSSFTEGLILQVHLKKLKCIIFKVHAIISIIEL